MDNSTLRGRALSRAAAALLSLGLCALSGLPRASADLLGRVAPPNELLIGFRPGTEVQEVLDLLSELGVVPLEEIEAINVFLVRLPAWNLGTVQEFLESLPIVEFVEQNERVEPVGTANDPYYGSAWHLPKIRATEVWDTTTGSPDVVIAILDSGVDGAHPDLAAKLLPGWNFYDGNDNTSDVYGHGTKVAGSAAAISNNGVGVASVAWQSYLLPVRVTDTAGYGYYSAITQGITYAADQGARVINLSFASVAGSSAITSAARYARSKGALVVTAAGNCGCDDPTPENPDLFSVGATITTDALATYSSRGAYVDVAAPGTMIYTTSRGGGYVAVAGTSFASPVTAGAIALLMAANPDLSPAEIEAALESTAVDLGSPGHDTSFGFGRIDVAAALESLAGISPPPADTTPPSASITSPTNGQVVSGTATINVMAFDDVNVAAVDLYRDGVPIGTDQTAPFSFAWNTTSSTDGSHSLQAVARDGAGNVGASSASNVTVANSVSTPTPTPTPTTRKKPGEGTGGRKK